MKTLFTDRIESPLGILEAVLDEGGALTALYFDEAEVDAGVRLVRDPARAQALRDELGRYFAGELCEFGIELAPEGTPFQRRVWSELVRIPYGETISYGELARRLSDPRAVRAVGRANATNPISILVPCHRVIGADGSLTGYAGGLERKRALLALEAAAVGADPALVLRA